MSTPEATELYGAAPVAVSGDYESPEDYSGQGDTRVVRSLMFSYLVMTGTDAAGNPILEPREARQEEEVTKEQIGLIALEGGEREHAFYTDAELDAKQQVESGQLPALTAGSGGDISSMGEHELADWLVSDNPETGRAWTINEVLQKVGNDKDLANRMLQAENIRGDGDPRAGLEAGLTRIIEG